jgi:hypothetical protein
MYVVKYLEIPYGEGFQLTKGSIFADVLWWMIPGTPRLWIWAMEWGTVYYITATYSIHTEQKVLRDGMLC